MVLIPSTAFHEVTMVELEEEDRDSRLGRYTLTLFITPTQARQDENIAETTNESKRKK